MRLLVFFSVLREHILLSDPNLQNFPTFFLSNNSFDLSKKISVDEAIFALDYIDHDFYVFRDAESGEVSVVYKRNSGGVGLIQPSQE